MDNHFQWKMRMPLLLAFLFLLLLPTTKCVIYFLPIVGILFFISAVGFANSTHDGDETYS